MTTSVTKPYKLTLSRLGGFESCTSAAAYPPFQSNIGVLNANNVVITYGADHPDWRGRIRRGLNASTDLTVTGTRLVKWVPANLVWRHSCRYCTGSPVITNKGTQWLYGSSFNSPSFPTSNPTSLSQVKAINLAKERFLLNALDKQRRFQGGVFLGELHKSLQMIRRPAKNLFSSLVGTVANLRKKGKLLPRHKRKEFLANSYLEATYGWAPLISDIQNGAEALAEYNLKRGRSAVYVRGSSGVDEAFISDTFTYPGFLETLGAFKVDFRRLDTSRVECKYYGKIHTEPASTLFLHERFFGLDLSSFVPTAWELIPYSFLVDYFTNIGNVINAWSLQTADLAWATRTVFRSYRRTYNTCINKTRNEQLLAACLGRMEINSLEELVLEKFRIERVADARAELLTVPSFRFRLPGTGMKWLNIAALAKAKFAKPFF